MEIYLTCNTRPWPRRGLTYAIDPAVRSGMGSKFGIQPPLAEAGDCSRHRSRHSQRRPASHHPSPPSVRCSNRPGGYGTREAYAPNERNAGASHQARHTRVFRDVTFAFPPPSSTPVVVFR